MDERGEATALQRATAAWRQVAGVAGPIAAERLTGGRHSTTVRLRAGARSRSSVVAKLRPRGGLELERLLHERVLPGLGLAVPAYLGFAPGAEGESDVLLLEYVGARPFRPSQPAHRDAAARWLGACHAASAAVVLPDPIPRRSLDEERERVSTTRSRLLDVQANPELDGAGRSLVSRSLELLAGALLRWPEWTGQSRKVPAVLTHGAFVARNVRVRGAGRSLVTLPFDWDHVAVRSPAVDLARVPGGDRGFAANASLEIYRETLATAGLPLARQTLDALAALGTAIRSAACIGWLVSTLAGPGARHALPELEIYRVALDAVLAPT
jgi:hypothetical protein